MFSIRNRISIDSLARIIFICALIVVVMGMVFVENAIADTSENTLDAKARIVNPREENTTPGDADDVSGRVKLDFEQEYFGNGDTSLPPRCSINPVANSNANNYRFISLIIYRLLLERSIVLLNR